MSQMLIGIRPVDGSVAVVTSAQEGPSFSATDRFTGCSRIILGYRHIPDQTCTGNVVVPEVVERVARQTECRLRSFKQILPNGPVGIVAGHAVFDGGRVFENPRAHQILVTARASLVAITTGDARILVWVVARKAAQRPFPHWVMGGHVLSGCDVSMTGNTKLRCLIHIGERNRLAGPQVFSCRGVRVVAIRTVEICARMGARAPLEMTVATRYVTGEAVLIGRIADILRIFAIRVEASQPVAAFAVLVIRRDLSATLHLSVTDRTLIGIDGLGSHNRLRSARPNGLPLE